MHILISGNARSSGGLGMKRLLRGTAHSAGNVSFLAGIENLWGLLAEDHVCYVISLDAIAAQPSF